MSKASNGHGARNPRVGKESGKRSGAIAEAGINDSKDYKRFFSALISDIIGGAVTPGVANAASNAGGKLLKCAELEMKYGTTDPKTNKRVLSLTDGPEAPAVQAGA